MKFQKTVLASLIFVATTAAWAQTGGASQPASNPNENLPNIAVTWPELDKVLNGDPNADESSDEGRFKKLGILGYMNVGFGHIQEALLGKEEGTDGSEATVGLIETVYGKEDATRDEDKGLVGKVNIIAEGLRENLPNFVLKEDFNEKNNAQDAKIDEKADKTELDKLKTELRREAESLYASALSDWGDNLNELGTLMESELTTFAKSVESSLNVLSDSVNNVLHGDTTAAEGSDERKGIIGVLNEKADKTEVTALDTKWTNVMRGFAEEVDNQLDAKADKTELTNLDTKWTNVMGGLAGEIDNRLDEKADKTELDKKANKAEFDNFKEETVANVENVGTIALGAEAAVNDLLDALYGKEGTDESGQLGEMYNAINEKADKTSLDVVKKQVANVAITTYKLDKQIADLAEQAGTAVETLNDNMLDLASTTVAMIAELAQSAEDDNQAQNAEIAKKADKVVVDDLIAKHNAAGEELGRFVNHVNDGFEKVGENLNTLAEKHDKAGEELARFVNHVNDGFEKVGENLNTLAAEKADKTEVEAVDAKVETLATNAQTAVDTLAQATRDLAAATDRELTGLKDKNTEMSGKLEATEVRVTNVEAAVRNLGTTQISALDARITANSDRINGLNTRVNQLSKELKRGMASQAALSGLFQPYNVGKVNITAAVGGYKSTTAVAIGAGYRVNNKFAAKAGVAFSAGSPAYNVGINYEF